MNIVKAVHKIKELLTDEQLDKLEYLALQYQRYAHIFFKIENIDKAKKVLVISVFLILIFLILEDRLKEIRIYKI